MQDAGDTENRLREICTILHDHVQASLEDGSRDALTMNTIRPKAHQCQCKVCITPDHKGSRHE